MTFQNHMRVSSDHANTIEEDLENLTRYIEAAEHSIPIVGGYITKRSVPWWNTEVENTEVEWRRLNKIYFLESRGNIVNSDEEIAEELALQFQKPISSENYDPLFRNFRNDRDTDINFYTNVLLPYNMTFSLKEFEEALDQVRSG
ncbi:hypothetical protein JTB14_003532 [Gonioctena quinquepunctata]|nr:hypothetical protein JTB14_003532 [Gonioctena quinquepunctata]